MSPLSTLVMTMYLGLIPVILVLGVVMAVRQRYRLGPRASTRLAIGAGLLLLSHAFTALRPLLYNMMPPYVFGGIADLIAAFSLLHLTTQAAGIGLIIAAVFAIRPNAQPADDHADGEEITSNSVGAPMPAAWKAAAVATVTVVLTAAGVWIWRTEQANRVQPWRETEQQQAARCLEHYGELNLPVKAKPEERMLLRQNGAWLRLYVSKPDNWITACHGNLDGLTGNFGTIMDDGPADKLRFFGGYDSVLKAHLLLGHMPTGGAFIEARLPNGQTIKGSHDGDIFVIWPPAGIEIEGAQVTVSTQDGAIIATANAPAEGD